MKDNPEHKEFLEKLNDGDAPKYFYSLNRYERKKNIPLALKAFAELKKTHKTQ